MTLYSVANIRSPTSIMMASRRYLDLLDPKPEDVHLDDIARGLAVPRFRNQCTRPVLVDDHLLRCGRIALALDQPLEVVVACLIHDAAEYAWGDMPGPIKRFMRVEVAGVSVLVAELEHKLLIAIAEVLIPWAELRERVLALLADNDGIVKRIDFLALYGEATIWMPGSEDWVLRIAIENGGFWPAMVGPSNASSWAEVFSTVKAWGENPCGANSTYATRTLLGRLRSHLLGV